MSHGSAVAEAGTLAAEFEVQCGFLCDATFIRYLPTKGVFLLLVRFEDRDGTPRTHQVGTVSASAAAPDWQIAPDWRALIRECAELAAAYKRTKEVQQ